MNLSKSLFLAFATASFLLVSVAPAETRCADTVARSARIERLRKGLARTLGLRRARWRTFPEGAGWAMSVTGLSDRDFEEAKRTLEEMKELIEQGSQGKIRGYGAYAAEYAGGRAVVWGVLGAATIAASFGLAEDVGPIVIRFLQGVAALSGYRTLRWFRTMDDALLRDRRLPEGNLWSALGPIQSPLQYWLKHLAFEGHAGLVLYLAREGAEAVRIDFGRTPVGRLGYR